MTKQLQHIHTLIVLFFWFYKMFEQIIIIIIKIIDLINKLRLTKYKIYIVRIIVYNSLLWLHEPDEMTQSMTSLSSASSKRSYTSSFESLSSRSQTSSQYPHREITPRRERASVRALTPQPSVQTSMKGSSAPIKSPAPRSARSRSSSRSRSFTSSCPKLPNPVQEPRRVDKGRSLEIIQQVTAEVATRSLKDSNRPPSRLSWYSTDVSEKSASSVSVSCCIFFNL